MHVVALFTRAWIEILIELFLTEFIRVALFTRAWIEIKLLTVTLTFDDVALFTRAWIEIEIALPFRVYRLRRPLHEGVD